MLKSNRVPLTLMGSTARKMVRQVSSRNYLVLLSCHVIQLRVLV
jgi:hypothetical protein